MNIICLFAWMGLICSASELTVSVESHPCSYGHAEVTAVHRIDENCILYCDIRDFPPIIGKNMPVKINGLRTSSSVEQNHKIQAFLNLLLMTKTDTAKKILLKDLQRGGQFCFLADIEINGQDICDLLVDNGLAQRIITVSAGDTPQSNSPQATRLAAERAHKNTFIASKTSKIFHRVGCSHAKRINPERAVYFSSRQDAVQTGRQPCKVCNP